MREKIAAKMDLDCETGVKMRRRKVMQQNRKFIAKADEKMLG